MSAKVRGGGCPFGPSRRRFLAGAGGLVATGGIALGDSGSALAAAAETTAAAARTPVVPFWGVHQGGIATPQQSHTVVAAFDLTTEKRGEVEDLFRAWTAAAARLTSGAGPTAESELLDLGQARLTLTFGFGVGLFGKDGVDRYGLAAQRPEALIDLPRFHGDQLVPAKTGGDLSVQACADDPQVAFGAIRELAALAYGAAALRWTQNGFLSPPPGDATPRNLMGFKDGTRNPGRTYPTGAKLTLGAPFAGFDDAVWVGAEGPSWMRGGSYVVIRRIRMALEHWNRSEADFQEEVIGRMKRSGAPIGEQDEFAAPDFAASDAEGNPAIAETAHLRLAAPETNDGAQIFRRGYSYNDGSNFTAERWPPWRQAVELDAGLLFLAYQRDPRTGFVKIFEKMAKLDALNQYTTHTGGGLFACPGGIAEGEFIGQRLFA